MMALRATPGWGATLAVLAALALPSCAAAESLVPPGNSAVDQYTETYPSAGGDRDTGGRGGAGRTPAQVLGPREARRLEERGAAGQAAAALAAAIAPGSVEESTAPATGDAASDGAAGDGVAGSGGAKGGVRSTGSPAPSGSSGLGEILGQATGLSASDGPLAILPLAILATALWSLAYLWRRKRSAP